MGALIWATGRLTGDISPHPARRRRAEGRRLASMRPAWSYPAQAEAEFEKRTLESALEAANGQISEAAKMLRISRATFYKKLAKFGLAVPDSSSV